MVASQDKWQSEAKNILKSALKRQGVDYKKLVTLLADIGVEETVLSVRGKMHRGTFSFAWVLQCFKALGIGVLRLD